MTIIEILLIAGLFPLVAFTILSGCLGSITHPAKRETTLSAREADQFDRAAFHAVAGAQQRIAMNAIRSAREAVENNAKRLIFSGGDLKPRRAGHSSALHSRPETVPLAFPPHRSRRNNNAVADSLSHAGTLAER